MTLLRARYLLPAYLLFWFALGFFTPANDLDIFFWPSAHILLSPHPFLAYTHFLAVPTLNGTVLYPNANGPLSLFPLALLGLLLAFFHLLSYLPLFHAVVYSFFSLFALLLAREAVFIIERLRATRLSSHLRLAVYATFALSPPLFQSLLGYGHIEQPLEVFLLLASLRYFDSSAYFRSGVLFALALLSRSPALFFVIPLLAALLFRPPFRPSSLLRFLTPVFILPLLVLLPFYLAAPSDLVRSLLTAHSSMPIYAGSIWVFASSTPLAALALHYDLFLVLLLSSLLTLYLATRPLGLTPLRLLSALTLTACSFILLAKTVWPYYFFEAFVFATLLFFASYSSSQSRAYLFAPSLFLCALGGLAELAVLPHASLLLIHLQAFIAFLLLALFMLYVTRTATFSFRLSRRQVVPSPLPRLKA